MENLDPPPNQGWENGAFWLLRDFILYFLGGDGGLLFHFISSKIVGWSTVSQSPYGGQFTRFEFHSPSNTTQQFDFSY